MLRTKKRNWFILTLILALLAVNINTAFATPNFDDLKNHYAESVINTALGNNWVVGYPDGTFEPDSTVTRAEFISIINNIFELPALKSELAFNDVKPDDWFYGSLVRLQECVNEYSDGTFKPNQAITRQEAAYIIYKLVNADSDFTSFFIDKDEIAPWAVEAVAAVYALSIADGYTDETFRPENNLTRAEAVIMLYNTYTANTYYGKFSQKLVVKDLPDKSDWVKPRELTLDEIAQRTGPRFNVTRNIDGTPDFIAGNFTDIKINTPDDAINALYSVKSLLQIDNPHEEFVPYKQDAIWDSKNFRLRQVYKSVPVDCSINICTDLNGVATSLSSSYNPNVRLAEIDINPRISLEEAKKLALEAVESVGYTVEDGDIKANDGNLLIYTHNTSPRLAWSINVTGMVSYENKKYYYDSQVFIDAHSGEHIWQSTNRRTVAATGKGSWGTTKTL